MPELWVAFDRNVIPEGEKESIGNSDEDYLDLRCLLFSEELDKAARQLGLKTVEEKIGTDPEVWEEMNQAMPEEIRRPWTPKDYPWFPAQYGIEWAEKLIEYIESNKQAFNDYDGHSKIMIEGLQAFQVLLKRAAPHDLKYNFLVDT